MKILWVTNIAIADAVTAFTDGDTGTGGWMEVTLRMFETEGEHEITILCSDNGREIRTYQKGKLKYYMLPGGSPFAFKIKLAKNRCMIEHIIYEEAPDLVQIWGTESALGLAVLKAAPDVPSIIFIQGVTRSIVRHFLGGISTEMILRNYTVYDIVRHNSIFNKLTLWKKREHWEYDYYKTARNVLSENCWCNSMCQAIFPEINIYHCTLPINPVFFDSKWNPDFSQHRIFCPASGNEPYKGLYMLLQAMKLVALQYPDVKLVVPGNWKKPPVNISQALRYGGYNKLINRYIIDNRLQSHIEFTGYLPAKRMADEMSKCNVFVMCSSVENHSSTLKEAMSVGVPCIASDVGGVSEYLSNGRSGLLYRFEEYEQLAYYIVKIFRDPDMATKLARFAKDEIAAQYQSNNFMLDIKHAYESITMGEKK